MPSDLGKVEAGKHCRDLSPQCERDRPCGDPHGERWILTSEASGVFGTTAGGRGSEITQTPDENAA